jgi:hypothetical protein
VDLGFGQRRVFLGGNFASTNFGPIIFHPVQAKKISGAGDGSRFHTNLKPLQAMLQVRNSFDG